MIKHISPQMTTVHFGKDGVGTVGLNGKRGVLVIQELISVVKIGEKFDTTKDISELPKVILQFNEVSSVEAMIKVLEHVKRIMEEPEYPAYCYAC